MNFMASFINLLGIFVRFCQDQPIGCSLLNRTNLLQNLNESYHKNQFRQLLKFTDMFVRFNIFNPKFR